MEKLVAIVSTILQADGSTIAFQPGDILCSINAVGLVYLKKKPLNDLIRISTGAEGFPV